MNVPETRYASSDGVNIAYQVVGSGPFDLVYVPGWVSNIEVMWEEPRLASFLERLASFSRLILFDKRGTGLSDPVPDDDLPTLERRMDDVRAVMDAAGSERAALLGHSEGGNMCILFAASFPERTSALVLDGLLRETLSLGRLPVGAGSRWSAIATSRRRSGPGGGSIPRRRSPRRSSTIRRSAAGCGGTSGSPRARTRPPRSCG